MVTFVPLLFCESSVSVKETVVVLKLVKNEVFGSIQM